MVDKTQDKKPPNIVKIQELGNGQLIITVPRAIAAFKGWKKGTLIEITEDRYGEVTLKEVKQ